MKDTWTHALTAFMPDYDRLLQAMNDGPKVRCDLTYLDKLTMLQISEYWDDGIETYDVSEDSIMYDDYIEWAEQQLSTWKNVKRMAWDQWYFTSRQDAEKFITLFNLKWAR